MIDDESSFSRRNARSSRRASQLVSVAQMWTPKQLPGLVLWLRADAGITIATGVSNWADQSGSGNNFAQATPGNQPTVSAAGGPTGGPAIAFASASSQFLTNLSAVIPNTNCTVFVVLKGTTITGSPAVIDFGRTNGGTGWGAGYLFGTSTRGMQANGGNTMQDSVGTTNWELWQIQSASNVWTFSVNGANQVITNPSTTPNAQAAASTIGALGTDAVEPWNGLVAEIVGCNSVLSASFLAYANEYFLARYGL
jgi:hypothetical protein